MRKKVMLRVLFSSILYCFALIGMVSLFCFINEDSKKQYQHIDDKKIILNKLIELSNSKISIKNCEHINNIKDLKVSDYFTLYFDLISSENNPVIENPALSCGSRKTGECALFYGGKSEWDKGWREVLFFDYDKATRTIDENSFEYFCQ